MKIQVFQVIWEIADRIADETQTESERRQPSAAG
jgi:hypothetical protein